ncbi:MAG TPA: hypothetical protein VKN99_19205, partial [Polyangia bacterium]|nr:hypothetical protein [Polyangia bacterium]
MSLQSHFRTVATALALALIGAGCLPWPGDRGLTGACPDGETCSPDTPKGLWFGGDYFGPGPGITAVGGTQSITISVANGDQLVPFARAFDARTTGSALRIAGISPPRVTVSALARGSGLLRILEIGSGHLYDRIEIDAEPIDHVAVVRDLDDWRVHWLADPVTMEEPFALFAGAAPIPVELRLVSLDDVWLVDESTHVEASAPTMVTQSDWNHVGISASAAGLVTLRVQAGDGVARTVSIPVVDRIDDLVLSPRIVRPPAEPFAVGETRRFCFRAISDRLEVLGLKRWSYQATGGVTLTLFGLGEANPQCVDVTGQQPGSATLTVATANAQKTISLVVASMMRRP